MKISYGLFGLAFITSSASATITFPGVNSYSAETTRDAEGKIDADVDLLSSSSDLYVNSVNVIGGSGWDPNIGLTDGGVFSRFDGGGNFLDSGNFSFGTAFTKGSRYLATGSFDGLFRITGASSAPEGVYSTVVEVIGGASATETSILGTFNLLVEVVSSYGVTVGYPNSTVVVPPVGTTTFEHQLTNSSGRDFFINSRFYSNGLPIPPEAVISFSGTYPSLLSANSQVTTPHLTFSRTGDFPDFNLGSGIFGGYYADDVNSVSGGQFTVTAVPEPLTLAVIGVGLVALRRKKK